MKRDIFPKYFLLLEFFSKRINDSLFIKNLITNINNTGNIMVKAK